MQELKLSISEEEFVSGFNSDILNQAIADVKAQGYSYYSFLIGSMNGVNTVVKVEQELVLPSVNDKVKELAHLVNDEDIVYSAYSSQNNALYVLTERGATLIREWNEAILEPPVETLDNFIKEFMDEKNRTYPFFVVQSSEYIIPNDNKVWIAYKRLGYNNYNLYYYFFGEKSQIWTITENDEVEPVWTAMTAELKTKVAPVL